MSRKVSITSQSLKRCSRPTSIRPARIVLNLRKSLLRRFTCHKWVPDRPPSPNLALRKNQTTIRTSLFRFACRRRQSVRLSVQATACEPALSVAICPVHLGALIYPARNIPLLNATARGWRVDGDWRSRPFANVPRQSRTRDPTSDTGLRDIKCCARWPFVRSGVLWLGEK